MAKGRESDTPSLLPPLFYQRNPKATGIMPTVPLPRLLDVLGGESTQT
jgi:hypothetical protein